MEKQANAGVHLKNALEGYRLLKFRMLDADIVAAGPPGVWGVLGHAGLLSKWNAKLSKKGTGFAQPLVAHEHSHIDASQPPDAQPTTVGRDSAGRVHPNARRYADPGLNFRFADDPGVGGP